jgi:dipeptidyl aminopeptidase/acylaminoacyl peptidase
VLAKQGGSPYWRLSDSGAALAPAVKVVSDQAVEVSLPRPISRTAALVELISYSTRGYESSVGLLELETGKLRTLVSNAGSPHYAPTGQLLFTRHDTLLAQPFDASRLEATGPPTAIAAGLRALEGHGWFDLSADGTLVYVPGGRVGWQRTLVVVDRHGQITPWHDDRRAFAMPPVVSSKGDRVALVVANRRDLYEVWTGDVSAPGLRRLAASPYADCAWALLSPDGDRLLYGQFAMKDDDGLYMMPVGGRSPARRIVPRQKDTWMNPMSWSPDGRSIVVEITEKAGIDIYVLGLDAGGGTLKPLLKTEFNESDARFSPDGKHLAYRSNESGKDQIYVASFQPGGEVGHPIPVSRGDSGPPHWSRDGRSLVYGANERLMSVAISTSPAIAAGTPVELLGPEVMRRLDSWELLPDGRLFAVQKGDDEGPLRTINVVTDWFTELKQRMAAGTR